MYIRRLDLHEYLRIRSIFRIPPSIMTNMFLSASPNPNALIFAYYILLLHPQIYFGFRYRTCYFTSMILTGMIFEIVHWILLTLERQESEFVVAGPAFVSVAIHRSFQNIAGLNDAKLDHAWKICGCELACIDPASWRWSDYLEWKSSNGDDGGGRWSGVSINWYRNVHLHYCTLDMVDFGG
jgi:hypothetical protein